ncbi:Nicotinamide mononucleotide adenylyltransferase [Ooceraea biroi]|uniref:Nicotinamide/nicotinic acid mononucleotide adenylyltransferase 3 n=1 Tax=Ooceraea biroi TaxID=2015173 RepID=A0A026WC92_OOCBI|nr:Nicotinamide mononucleotide adenylyltransferase [Ooceraea biroi]
MAPTRVILMSCGSYNPPTNMHLRMFEIARDHLHRMGTHVVVGGVISPVHDAYAKKELASAMHRCSMLRLALQNSDWIRLSTWETRQNCWTKTRVSLQHHQNLLNSMLSNSNDIIHHLQTEDTDWIPENVKNSSDNTPIQIKLLCGADLLESFAIPGLWVEEDIDAIVGEHGLVVITREGSNPNKFIYDSDILSKHMHNICIVTEWIPNEVSSTRIRRALKRSESVRYLLQDSVIDYIYKHEIYDARAPDTTIKLELSSPNANNYLHIDPRYLAAFLTPSPSDVTMDSPSPIEIAVRSSIDVPDAVVLRKNLQNAGCGGGRLDEAREQFINNTIGNNVDNGNIKHVAKAAYPGQAKQVIANKIGIARIVEVGLPDEPKFRSDSSSEDRRSTMEGIARDKVKIEQRELSDLRSKTKADLDRRFVESNVKESVIKGKTEIEQREVLQLRSKANVTDVDLGSNNDGEVIVRVQPANQSSSSELRLGECCWPTRENTANNKAEICSKNIISTKEIFDISEFYLDDRNTLASKKIIDNESTDQSNLNKLELEKDSKLIAEGKDDISSKEISIKKEIHDVKPNFVETDNVVKIQPAHSSHNIVVTKKDNSRLMTEQLTDTKIMSEERKSKYKENLELNNTEKNDAESAKSGLERIMKNNVKMDDTEISFKKEIADSELDKVRYSETKATASPLNVSMTSLDGRHECALSDFSVDKEDYRLSQYVSEGEEKGKSLRTAESSLTKHIDDQSEYLTDTADSIGNNKICAKKDDIQSSNSQVLVSAMIHKSYEGEPDYVTTEEIDNRAKSLEETDQQKFIEERLFSEIKTNDKIDVDNREQSDFDAQSSERRVIPNDPNLEIDGKYLKSIVNSRKSPKKIRDGQVYDIDIKEQYRFTDNQPMLLSEEFQSPSRKMENSERVKKDQIYDASTDIEKKDRIIDNEEMSHMKEIFQDSSKIVSTKTKSARKIDELYVGDNKHEFKDHDKSISDREAPYVENVFQKKASQKSSRTSTSTKSPKKMRKSQIIYRSNEMKDYDRSINDRVISQLEEVFQDFSKKPLAKPESSKIDHESYIETKKQHLSVDSRDASRFEELPQRSSKMSSMKSPKRAQEQKSVKMDDKKEQSRQEKMKETRNAENKTKQDFHEIKDVYTRKVRRYNVPLQGSLDSMIVSEELNMQKPKKDDAFSKKSKSYESIKRMQEVFLGVPPSKANSSGSQLDIPDEFCSICCYMNEINFRTEEEVSSPNQETFYTLRSTCSSLADDDESIECDICESLNLQEPIDDLEGKVQEIPCELCRICGEVDGSYEQSSALPSDRYTFKVAEPRDDDDSFEIENCGFQSGTESTDDRSRISEKEKIKDTGRPKSQSLFIHGSSMIRDQPRELYFIPKDEIAILTSGARKISRKGSLFRKKEDVGGSARDNRRYSSVDSLQLAKMSSKANDKMLEVTKDPTLIGSADNLISRDSRRSKSLQRSADDRVECLNSSAGNLVENLEKENEPEGSVRKSSIRDKEAVKMILTQHGIKIISEKETAL